MAEDLGLAVRLSPEQAQAIKTAGEQVLGKGTRAVLFGSRVSGHVRGGDIDLLFESPRPVPRPARAVCDLYAALVMELGEQKIDILIKDPATPLAPVIQQALQTGIEL